VRKDRKREEMGRWETKEGRKKEELQEEEIIISSSVKQPFFSHSLS
jgi:hypothetical protein